MCIETGNKRKKYLSEMHLMKTRGVVVVWEHSFYGLTTINRRKWKEFSLPAISQWHLLHRKMDGPRFPNGHCADENNFGPGRNQTPILRSSKLETGRYSELPRPLGKFENCKGFGFSKLWQIDTTDIESLKQVPYKRTMFTIPLLCYFR
jgi:hypothetical protein